MLRANNDDLAGLVRRANFLPQEVGAHLSPFLVGTAAPWQAARAVGSGLRGAFPGPATPPFTHE
jgi:hypothetical protein